jgi:2-oxoglutarate ferredoxin oxidoreductase subunit beta
MTVAKDLSSITKYLREEELPHIWCPGCGNGIVVGTLLRAIAELESENFLEQDKVVAVSGIGCSSRAVNFLNFNTLHTTHGRAIPFATGIKLANPELTVIVLSGDGDATAIGGNHFLHACRRNIDINLVIFNNYNYGMIPMGPPSCLHDVTLGRVRG